MIERLPDHLRSDPERVAKAQERVDAATPESYQLALDTIFDAAIQFALLRRSDRERINETD